MTLKLRILIQGTSFRPLFTVAPASTGLPAPTAAAALGADAAEYAAENLNPYVATERGLVDAVIEPSQTRKQVLEGLRLLERKVVYPVQKKHGNLPV